MSHHAEQTVRQIFAHPTSHNIHWRDIVHMFEKLGGTCDETKKDHLKVILHGHEMTFPIPKQGHHTLEDDHEISEIRRFLKLCGVTARPEH
jgi:hypothetical protein